ncbi:maleate cis-trans isomerase family protein [Alicyclobacillus fastidiosus]|uniref:maleate cis-trans isomerase family protein n=1 Tax=Alicyclobacillus fastidiosus TaxID=392011 RepID=UPI0024E0C45C|nr:hypothetical protein [Alicyclobacillus fastidiosus]
MDGNQSIAQAIIDHTGIPTVTATSAMVQALHFLGLQRVSLVAPYTEDRTRTMIEFLQHMSIDVDGVEQRDFAERGTDPREWYECNLQPPTTAYLMARRAYRESVDGVVISATNFRTFEVISALEADLGKPVVTTNQAILWAVFQLLGIRCHIPVLGRLHNIERG